MSQNKKLLNELAQSIKNVDASEQPNRIVKDIDKIIQNYYTKFYDIKQVSSYTDSNIMKIRTHKDSFEMDIDIINVNKIENQFSNTNIIQTDTSSNYIGLIAIDSSTCPSTALVNILKAILITLFKFRTCLSCNPILKRNIFVFEV